ncbi:hypothetical protein TrLO_g2438 [Triparma laevis f. longispina]|uniref:DNA replication licensing factor MCM7 n=1 Tax=Triparma laevis f. longispina TaxID=1714387 RepID=A0A9W7KX43_9STRA|nr:hypothetical protein TrLO_g2438 [Triparma laevis f. longispina]
MSQADGNEDTSQKDIYTKDQGTIKSFLVEFSQGIEDVKPYYLQLREIKDRTLDVSKRVLTINLSDVSKWSEEGAMLADRAQANAKRYHEIFAEAIDSILEDSVLLPTNPEVLERRGDVIDILHRQRLETEERHRREREGQENGEEGIQNGGMGAENEVESPFPKILFRRYELRLAPQSTDAMSISLRHIRSSSIGKLVSVRGMITRCSDVKPHCEVCAYSCDRCGFEIFQQTNGKHFTPIRMCPSPVCSNQGASGEDTVHTQTRGSKFTKYQEVKLQELPNQVPIGHIPRSMNVHVLGELTRTTSPGDIVKISGVFLPTKFEGYKALKAGLTADTYLRAFQIEVEKKSYDDREGVSAEKEKELTTKVEAIAFSKDPVGRLSRSIAPEIFGHDDVKRALLLQLVSGCEKKLSDGMRIRGDINICLMGDPGVAKSQLLKYISSVAPRGVYTTGKGSSGVGLTAAITKDSATGDMALEGGALVLADKGVCCIDEFDKMDESDRTAIHEVMEQQTVSIAKAGITATLNARAAVLAAANPLYGRYNRRKGLSENINLPNSLLSRFDLMFLILDVADTDNDIALARHVTFVHKHSGATSEESGAMKKNSQGEEVDDEEDRPVQPDVVREYISRARQHQPSVPPEVAPYVVEAYVSLRQQDTNGPKDSNNSDQTVMTARQLLSILRLAQALARLRFSDFVATEDVDEAIRLTHMSKASLLDSNTATNNNAEDITSRIFGIIRDYNNSVRGSTEVEYKAIEAMVLRKGFNIEQLNTCLEEYESLNILQLNEGRTAIEFLMDN